MSQRPIIAFDKNLPNATFLYAEETLNQMQPPCFPPYKLHLKPDEVIIMLRNLNPRQGLCIGTRLKVTNFTQNVIEAVILTGPKQGRTSLIPRCNLLANKTCPIHFIRYQFPVKIAKHASRSDFIRMFQK